MRYSVYITLITALLTITGFLSLTLIEELGGGTLLLIGIVTGISLAINAFRPISIPHAVWNVIAVITLVLFFFDYLYVSGNLVAAGSHVTAALVVFKLYDLKTRRDFALFAVLVFLEVLAAAASTASPLFFLLLIAFVLTSIWTMAVFNVKDDCEKYSSIKEPPRGVFGASFFATTVTVTIASMIMTMALFFVIPRMAIGLFETKTLNTIKVVGFSDVVDLGSFGETKQNSSVVMRVELPDFEGKLENLYMRGAVLDSFDGKQWSRTKKTKNFLRNSFDSFFSPLEKRRLKLIQQKILLEPLETDVIFALDGWTLVNGKFRGLLTDDTHALYLAAPSYSKSEYTVQSYANWHQDVSNPEELRRYLQLPNDSSSIESIKRIRALSRELTSTEDNEAAKAQKIESYLGSSFTYNLNPKRLADVPPLDDFLFNSKEGYCEHFATAMAVMLRTIGIPSRIVTGFVNGEYNAPANYYILRQSDAHSWVEAYIKGTGWTRFDPTPSQGTTTAYSTSSVLLYMDSLTWHWNRYVINYTLTDQIRLGVTVEGAAAGFRNKLKALLSDPLGKTSVRSGNLRNIVPYAVVAAVLIIIIIVAVVIRREAAKNAKFPYFYALALRRLKKKGYIKETSETPREFAERTGISAMTELTEYFYLIRYGGKSIAPEAEKKLLDMAKGL